MPSLCRKACGLRPQRWGMEVLLDGVKCLECFQGALPGVACGQNASGGAKAENAKTRFACMSRAGAASGGTKGRKIQAGARGGQRGLPAGARLGAPELSASAVDASLLLFRILEYNEKSLLFCPE